MTRSGKTMQLLVLALVVGLFLVHALYFRALFLGNCIDDAYISFRYADNLAAGNGLVFNPGERVEGYSNFLWTLALTPFARSGDLTLTAQALGIVFSIATLLLLVWSLRNIFQLLNPVMLSFAALVVATSGYFAGWAVGGLEGPLHGLLLLAAWAFYPHDTTPAPKWQLVSALCFSALVLSRPEGIFLALGAMLFHLGLARLRKERLLSKQALFFPAVIGISLLVYEGWRFAYFGPSLFPNSVTAKIGGGLLQFERGLHHVLENFCLPYLPLVLIPLVLLRWNWRRVHTVLGLGLLGGYLAFIACAGGDWSWGRFLGPLLPLGAALTLTSLAGTPWLVTQMNRRGLRYTAIVTGLLFVVVSFQITSINREMQHRRTYAPLDAERIALGKWLAEEAAADTVIAVYAAGQIPYYSGLYTHDMLGLTDRHIAAEKIDSMGSGGAGHEKYNAAYTLETIRPGIIIGGRFLAGIREHPLFINDYVDIPRWRANNVRIHRHLLGR
jgi:arabinofuranosyltransferase